MIVKGKPEDFQEIHRIINDGASAYRGVIPSDRWREPYMSEKELQTQIDEGVQFWCYRHGEDMVGVMGIQNKGEVTLIRHAYVQTADRGKGIGGTLLAHLTSISSVPILIGTWADAKWAVEFYQKHGFRLVSALDKERLLRKYWSIPERQIETSVVLASEHWNSQNFSY